MYKRQIPFLGSRKPEDAPAELFLGDERVNHQRSRRVGSKDVALMLGITVLYACLLYTSISSPENTVAVWTSSNAYTSLTGPVNVKGIPEAIK